MDESWGVDPQSITEGLEPALLERLWAQLHLTSTAHVKATSLMRRRLVAVLRNADPDVLILMWGARSDADWSKEATWRAASPHWTKARRDLVARKYAAALAGQDEPEFDDPDPIRGWAAQYLNVWPLLLGPGRDSILPVGATWPLSSRHRRRSHSASPPTWTRPGSHSARRPAGIASIWGRCCGSGPSNARASSPRSGESRSSAIARS